MMTHVAGTAYESKSGKQPCRTALFKYHGLHEASIGRAAFEAIADEPLFAHQQGPPGATQLTFRDVFEPDPPNDKRRRIRFGAGSVARVATALIAKGIAVRNCDQLVWWVWTEVQPNDTRCQFLVRAIGRLRSLGVVPNLADRICNIAELCRLQPDSNILIVAKNDNEAKAMAKMLKAATGRDVSYAPDIPNSHPWLHVICSPGLYSCCTIYWGVVIFMDAELALSKTASEYLATSLVAVRTGFLTRDERRLLPVERNSLEALFGPIIYRPGDGSPRTEVSVAWLRSTKDPAAATSTVDRKRKQVWANGSRNELIARAARSLRDNRLAGLKMIGLQDTASWLGEPAQQPTVAIIVENVEHAEHLARLLPGWRLEAQGYIPPPGRYVIHDRVIMTLARAAEALVGTSVVIYAAAGTDRWLEHAKLIGDAWAMRRMLIVDIDDHYDARSEAETRSRAVEYQYGLRVRANGDAARPIERRS
jgi:hypothetical protein